jgi:hypothetical protein
MESLWRFRIKGTELAVEQITVANRDYHQLSQCEIGGAKRFSWRYSLDIRHRFPSLNFHTSGPFARSMPEVSQLWSHSGRVFGWT